MILIKSNTFTIILLIIQYTIVSEPIKYNKMKTEDFVPVLTDVSLKERLSARDMQMRLK